MQQWTTDSLTRAETEYRRAIALDPAYAAAYLGLGSAEWGKSGAKGMFVRTEEERRTAEQAFGKALELDPDLPMAHTGLARIAMQYDWDWERAAREFQLALAGPPAAEAERSYASFLIVHGRFAEAESHIRRYEELDPFSTETMLLLATHRNLEGRFAEAREISRKLVAAYPKVLAAHEMIVLTYLEENRPDLALASLEPLKQEYPVGQFWEAMARARAGQRAEALRMIRPFEEKYPNTDVAVQWFSLVYAFMGDEANTVKWLARSADRREWPALTIAIHPAYAQMRNSTGFRALSKRMGLN